MKTKMIISALDFIRKIRKSSDFKNCGLETENGVLYVDTPDMAYDLTASTTTFASPTFHLKTLPMADGQAPTTKTSVIVAMLSIVDRSFSEIYHQGMDVDYIDVIDDNSFDIVFNEQKWRAECRQAHTSMPVINFIVSDRAVSNKPDFYGDDEANETEILSSKNYGLLKLDDETEINNFIIHKGVYLIKEIRHIDDSVTYELSNQDNDEVIVVSVSEFEAITSLYFKNIIESKLV